ncbi:hypothetical protein, partial [Rhizobium wenxiniae]|uniref:hypothetical protein n=1 Tax=Rhizobium wenxiniae TaxID=1737357 RepID=UPI001C6E5353
SLVLPQNANDLFVRETCALHSLVLSMGQSLLQNGLFQRGKVNPDRRATVIHRGEKFRCSPLSWQELMTGSLADDHAKAGAISSLVAVGACDTTRQPIGLLQRMKMKKS